MALAGMLTDAEIAAGLASCKEPGSFNIKTFSAKSGMRGKPRNLMLEFFRLFDENKDGFIDKDELQKFLKVFASSARLLTDAETTAFLNASDFNGDGKIGFDEFVKVVNA